MSVLLGIRCLPVAAERADELPLQPVEDFFVGHLHALVDPVRELHLLECQHLADEQLRVVVHVEALGNPPFEQRAGNRGAIVPEVAATGTGNIKPSLSLS